LPTRIEQRFAIPLAVMVVQLPRPGQQFTGANAVLADTGETFADLKAKRLAA